MTNAKKTADKVLLVQEQDSTVYAIWIEDLDHAQRHIGDMDFDQSDGDLLIIFHFKQPVSNLDGNFQEQIVTIKTATGMAVAEPIL